MLRDDTRDPLRCNWTLAPCSNLGLFHHSTADKHIRDETVEWETKKKREVEKAGDRV